MLKYIFLTSSGYSGSTLLSFMLGAHPRIASIGELANSLRRIGPDDYQCSCGKLIKNCPFWQLVTMRMHKTYNDFLYKNFGTRLEPKSRSFIDRLQFSNFRNNKISNFRDYLYSKSPTHYNYAYNITKRSIDLANVILDITKKDIFFDTSKDPKRIKFLKQYLKCEFKVIHLVKDGRGVFDSIKKYSPGRSDLKAIRSWKKVNRLADRAMRYVDKKNRCVLLYRDLSLNPEDTLTKLCNFIGVKYSSQCINFRYFDHHIIGNAKMRLGTNARIYYDEKWKKSLSPEQLKLFDRLAGKMNKRYGYS